MGYVEGDLSEKGLVGFAVFPVVGIEEIFGVEVEVCLGGESAAVSGVVALFFQSGSEG